jgi:hypothetical protein
MTPSISLAPRYRLDDELPWLVGIDPARYYWITVNGDVDTPVALPGLTVSSLSEFKQTIRKFRSLQPQQQMQLLRTANSCTIHCISLNCYAVEIDGTIPVWHLFDQETLESLLMSAHPDWQCAERDIDLGRQMLMRSLEQSLVA